MARNVGFAGKERDGLAEKPLHHIVRLIGRVPGHPRIHAAFGYGGNGITYSYLASRMIAASIAGNDQPWFDDFAIDRDAPEATP